MSKLIKVKDLNVKASPNKRKFRSVIDVLDARHIDIAAPIVTIGHQVKLIREYKKMSQLQLAVESKTIQTQISKIEQDKANPTLQTLQNIAKALDCNLVIRVK